MPHDWPVLEVFTEAGEVAEGLSFSAIVGVVGGALGALASLTMPLYIIWYKRSVSRRDEAARYYEPLLRAAYDLQSRIYNILKMDFLKVFVTNAADEDEKSYAVHNTVFLFAQYFAWTEIARRQVRFIDLGRDAKSRELAHLQDELTGALGRDAIGDGASKKPLLRIFAGEQRELGERMIIDGQHGPMCESYASFVTRQRKGESHELEARLERHIRACQESKGFKEARERLELVQGLLIMLLYLLDPKHLRFPVERRSILAPERMARYLVGRYTSLRAVGARDRDMNPRGNEGVNHE